jgi:hypothetical protein
VQVLQVAAVGARERALAVPEVDRFLVLDLAGTTAITGPFHTLTSSGWGSPVPLLESEGEAAHRANA